MGNQIGSSSPDTRGGTFLPFAGEVTGFEGQLQLSLLRLRSRLRFCKERRALQKRDLL